ncbi:hypothetical protein C5614_04410 [Massilia phosphatilytica]|jgi:hypothetical protein|nr:hypothetical protein C5614_04410 [Massilia phosphatilytica]
MMTKKLKRAVPNERWDLVLQFDEQEYRLFPVSILYWERDWKKLAYPQHMKRFMLTSDAICWDDIGTVDAAFLYDRSIPIEPEKLDWEVLRLGYKNQAPTPEDKHHHVYGVFLARFGRQPFKLDESIGGGMAERGRGHDYSLHELLLAPEWKQHFVLSGCSWAIPIIESHVDEPERTMDLLVHEACLRNGV